jgi:topoisomerase-4 subunit B
MNPMQLRETTMDPNTRRLVRLELKAGDKADSIMDMLLAKARSNDRKEWLSLKGNKADVEV